MQLSPLNPGGGGNNSVSNTTLSRAQDTGFCVKEQRIKMLRTFTLEFWVVGEMLGQLSQF